MLNASSMDKARSYLDPQFNATIIEVFLLGIYTLIFFQVIWKLYEKGNKRLYCLTLILLWLAITVNGVCNWNPSRVSFAVHNSSPIDIVNSLSLPTPVGKSIPPAMATVLSDGILIWRCNILWRNGYILAAQVALLGTTTVLLIYSFTPASISASGILNSLGIFSSLTTTVSATSLIAFKIVLVTRRSRMAYSYGKILEILVQSAALVSILLSAAAILQLFSPKFNHDTPRQRLMYNITIYVHCSLGPIIGIGPTLISFRVVEDLSEPISNTQGQTTLSRLTFKRSTHSSRSQTRQTRVSIIHTVSTVGVEQLGGGQPTMGSGHEENIPIEHVEAVENQNQLSAQELV